MSEIRITVRVELSPETTWALRELVGVAVTALRAVVAGQAPDKNPAAEDAKRGAVVTHVAPSAPDIGPETPVVAEQAPPPPSEKPPIDPQREANSQRPMPTTGNGTANVHQLNGNAHVAGTKAPAPAPVPTLLPANGDGPMWTKARIAVLERDYRAGRSLQDILASVAALPGDKIGSKDQIARKVSKLGLKRPDPSHYASQRALSPELAPDTQASGRVAAPPPPPATPASPLAPPSSPHPERTAARMAVLRTNYCAGDAIEQIVGALNALPGPAISGGQVVAWIGALNLKRDPTVQAQLDEQKPIIARAPPPIISAPPAPQQPQPPSKRMTPERQALLERDWPSTRPTAEIFQEFNSLPGPPMPWEQLAIYASKLGLKRPVASRVAQMQPGVEIRHDAAEEQGSRSPTVDWAAALQWAQHNRVAIPEGTSRSTARILINDARRAAGLPQWVIVEAHRNLGKLPHPHFGGEDHRRAE